MAHSKNFKEEQKDRKALEDFSVKMEKLEKELKSDNHYHVIGKLFNAFFMSNTKKVKDYNHNSVDGVINTHTEDKSKSITLAKNGGLLGMGLLAGTQFIPLPEILNRKSELWGKLVESGISEEKVFAAQNFFGKLGDDNRLDENVIEGAFSYLNTQFGVMFDLPPESVLKTLLFLTVVGGIAQKIHVDYNTNTMYTEEKIAEYSDDIDDTQSTAELRHLKNSSLVKNKVLSYGGSKNSGLGKYYGFVLGAVNNMALLPKAILSKVGHSMIKEEKTLFENLMTASIQTMGFTGYGLASLQPTNQLKQVQIIRDKMIGDTKHVQSSSSTIKEDVNKTIQDTYENILRRKVKVSMAKAIYEHELATRELKLIKEKKEIILESSDMINKKLKSMKSIKQKEKLYEKKLESSQHILKGVAKLHLQKSNQLNNHYESISNLAAVYLQKEYKYEKLKDKVELIAPNIDFDKDMEESIKDVIKYIDKDLSKIVSHKQNVKINERINDIIEDLGIQFEEKGLKSKNNFIKKIKKVINNQVENLYKQNTASHCTDELFNEIGNILNNNIKVPLMESQRIKFLKFCENLSEDLNQDKSNQNIKNPEDFNKSLLKEQPNTAEMRKAIVRVQQNGAALTSRS
tara:strand:+ start:296 stop:2182 length:1887 start_codon:yes stop_codon:yes gene_type:complete